MKILALEASAAAASCALLEDDRLLGENFLNLPQTHSQTLMPMAQRLLETAGVSAREMDLIAVSAGPGSFTGLRIAMAAAKGMAFPGDTPCAGVSTLEALAYNLPALEGAVLPAMDARCGQVYAAMFDLAEGRPRRVIAGSALAVGGSGSAPHAISPNAEPAALEPCSSPRLKPPSCTWGQKGLWRPRVDIGSNSPSRGFGRESIQTLALGVGNHRPPAV